MRDDTVVYSGQLFPKNLDEFDPQVRAFRDSLGTLVSEFGGRLLYLCVFGGKATICIEGTIAASEVARLLKEIAGSPLLEVSHENGQLLEKFPWLLT